MRYLLYNLFILIFSVSGCILGTHKKVVNPDLILCVA